jgi:hypothetical protein
MMMSDARINPTTLGRSHKPQDLYISFIVAGELEQYQEHLSLSVYFGAGRQRRTSWLYPTNASHTSARHPVLTLQQRDVGSY